MNRLLELSEIDLPEKRIELQDMDLENGPFCMSHGTAPPLLAESIERVGLLQPPLIRTSSEGKYDVVCGFRRLRALEALGRTSCLCRDLAPLEYNPVELLELALLENLATRAINDVEKGLVLEKLGRHVDRETLIRKYMPLLNLSPRKTLLDNCLALADADPPVKEAVAQGTLSFKAFQAMRGISREAAKAICRIFNNLNYSFNKQLQFIDYIKDISYANNQPIADVLRYDKIIAVLENPSLNTPQKSTRILEYLRRLRLPVLTEAEQSFQHTVSDCKLPKGVRVHHPPFFEGSEFRLEISFKSGKELREKIRLLHKNQALESLGTPWKGKGE